MYVKGEKALKIGLQVNWTFLRHLDHNKISIIRHLNRNEIPSNGIYLTFRGIFNSIKNNYNELKKIFIYHGVITSKYKIEHFISKIFRSVRYR